MKVVKYMPPMFNGDVVFVFPPINWGVLDAYGRAMNDMDKMYDGHVWCTIKRTNILNEFGSTFTRFACIGHLQCLDDSCEFLSRNGGLATIPSRLALHPPHLLWVKG